MAYYLITYAIPGFGPFGVPTNEIFNDVTDRDPIDWLWDKNIINRDELDSDGNPVLDKKGRKITKHNSHTYILINYKEITEDQYKSYISKEKESGNFLAKYYKLNSRNY